MATAPKLIIRPRIGLSDLKFGASHQNARDYLGEPESVEGLDAPSPEWLTWQYPSIGVDASFDAEFDFRLISLSVTSEEASLFGCRFIGLDGKTALERAAECPLGPYKRADDALGWEAEFHEADLEFRFDGDRLWLISWRVFIDEQDVVHWPE